MKQTSTCPVCGRTVDPRRLFDIDGVRRCSTCIYGDTEPLEIFPIGIVKKPATTNVPPTGEVRNANVSRIELVPSQKPFLYKVEEERRLTIVYYLHKSGPVKSVFSRGLDGKRTGLFATRTPHRLSKIAIQDVRLVQVEETTLIVEGLDAIDGSPVLDIKLCWNRI